MSWLQHVLAFERAVATPYTLATVLVPPLFSFYVMAVLVQLPRTNLYRVALLPVVFWTSFRAAMSLDFARDRPDHDYLNQALLLTMFTIPMRSTAWVLNARPTYTRLPICKSGNGTVNRDAKNTPVKRGVSVSTAMWNAWDLIANLRGIGWDGPPRMHLPTPYVRVESRATFVSHALARAVFLGLAFDASCTYCRFLGRGSFGALGGGSIFDPSLAPLERYTRSSVVTLVVGACAYLSLELIYQSHAALLSTLFQHHPSQWPPLFDAPWCSTSLASLWGRRWHQVFREMFVVVGSRPMESCFGRAGGVLGAFVVSGVLHDVGMRGMRRYDGTLQVIGFFVLHGVGVMLEYAWKRATGRRVGGVAGFLWVYFWVISSGHLIVDAWARCGLLASAFYPEAYSPTVLFLNWMSERGL